MLERTIPDRPGTIAIGALVAEAASATNVFVSSSVFGEAVQYGGGVGEVVVAPEIDPITGLPAPTPELPGVAGALAERLWTVPLTITVNGDYASVVGFLRILQESERIIFVESAVLSSGDDGRFALNITAHAYTVVGADQIAADAATRLEALRESGVTGLSSVPVATPTPSPEETPVPTETPAP